MTSRRQSLSLKVGFLGILSGVWCNLDGPHMEVIDLWLIIFVWSSHKIVEFDKKSLKPTPPKNGYPLRSEAGNAISLFSIF